MAKNYLGSDIKKLGFGLMRLPKSGSEIDIEQTIKMVDYFMENGFTYFDTAYVYDGGKSEEAAKTAIVDRYDRGSFQLATKLPFWGNTTRDVMKEIFETSLNRTGASYFDFYLLHALDRNKLDLMADIDAWGYAKSLKDEGKIKHLGFSFHDDAKTLEKILSMHGDITEFVQLQINYSDWESDSVQSRLCYEVAMKYEKPVIIMEPIKGGELASLTYEARNVLKKADPESSIASWALRYCASLDNIITVLSGMSSLSEMYDNVKTFKDFVPLSKKERESIDEVVSIINSLDQIPCTACGYCVEECPQEINIPGIIKSINRYTLYNRLEKETSRYNAAVKDGGSASDCIECGACEARCPQKIEIISAMKKAAEIFE